MYKIFVVEDDKKMRDELMAFFGRYGYICQYTDDFQDVVGQVLLSGADLVLLDINLPFFDGYHVCRELRKVSGVPIIVVTSRDSELDELMSMNLGADDFITKPYNTQILLARIAALLARTYRSGAASLLEHAGVRLDMGRSTLLCGANEAELTKNEARILGILMRSKGSIVPRDEIIGELWQTDEFIDDNTLTVNVNRLRKKLEQVGAIDYIKTKRGQGYMV